MFTREDCANDAKEECTEATESGVGGNPADELAIVDETKGGLDACILEDPADEGMTGMEATIRLEEGSCTADEGAILDETKDATDTPEEGVTDPALTTLDPTEPRETDAREVAYGHAARQDSMVR